MGHPQSPFPAVEIRVDVPEAHPNPSSSGDPPASGLVVVSPETIEKRIRRTTVVGEDVKCPVSPSDRTSPIGRIQHWGHHAEGI